MDCRQSVVQCLHGLSVVQCLHGLSVVQCWLDSWQLNVQCLYWLFIVSYPMIAFMKSLGKFSIVSKNRAARKTKPFADNDADVWYLLTPFVIVSKLGTVSASNEEMIDTDSFEFCSHHRQWWCPFLSEIFSNGTKSHRMSFNRYSPA